MKKILSYATIIVLFFSLSSCEIDDASEDDYIAASDEKINLYYGDKKLEIYCFTHWTVTDIPDWVEVTPVQGEGRGEIYISLKENIERHFLSSFYIKAGNGKCAVYVTCDKSDEY